MHRKLNKYKIGTYTASSMYEGLPSFEGSWVMVKL